uniref:CD9 antigen n=1 Tax=Latimeria chalumnae TaxID=7897 RepID=H2ZVA6_LATCH
SVLTFVFCFEQFFFCLFVIFGLEIAAGIWGFSNQDKIIEELKNFYTETYQRYVSTKEASLKETLRAIHTGLDCCGIGGILEPLVRDTCPKKDLLDEFTRKSCIVAINDVFTSKLNLIGGIGIGIAVIMIFGMIFSMILCCAIRRNREMV